MAKKRVKKTKKSVRKGKSSILKSTNIKKKTGLIWKNLVLFVILFVVSLVLYSASGSDLYRDLFFVLSIFFGFIGLAFFIALLVYIFLKYLK